MKKLFRRKSVVYIALLCWLLASASGMHGHYCFDGLEAPVSVHFDLLNGLNDSDDVGHDDFDSNPLQVSTLKITNLDVPFLALAALFIWVIFWPIIRDHCYPPSKTFLSWLITTGLRPPLRAPPQHSY